MKDHFDPNRVKYVWEALDLKNHLGYSLGVPRPPDPYTPYTPMGGLKEVGDLISDFFSDFFK